YGAYSIRSVLDADQRILQVGDILLLTCSQLTEIFLFCSFGTILKHLGISARCSIGAFVVGPIQSILEDFVLFAGLFELFKDELFKFLQLLFRITGTRFICRSPDRLM